MMDLPALLDELRRDEGVRLTPYADTTGHLTIGYGHNLTDRGISPAIAEAILNEDVDEVLLALLKFTWFLGLSDIRQRVVANLAFNIGIGGLLQFRRFLAAIGAARYDDAADELLDSDWARQVGTRAQRLAAMMRTDHDVERAA